MPRWTGVGSPGQGGGPKYGAHTRTTHAHAAHTAERPVPASGRLYQVNVKGVFHCLQAGVKKMLSDGRGGAIVNLASIASLIGLADRFAHAGSGPKRPAT